jgi:hypothetical protein
VLIEASINELYGKYQFTTYQYGEDDVLKKVSVKHGYDYRDVEFKYINGRIDEVLVTTNRVMSAYLRHWLHLDINEFVELGTNPILVRDVFEYDENGNRIAKRTYLGDELFSEVLYLLSYQ